jgi:ornithine cyclodeaminase/alanine dehydrogenase-like protein (mu-crystallin family)
MPVLYLTEDEVRSLLTMDLALPAVESAFRKLSLDEAENIPRRRCQTDQVMLHVLPAAAKTLNAIGFKAYTTSRTSGTEFRVYLFDPKAGGLTAILEADHLGRVRTGAASGVATKVLARKDATKVGVFGSGRQARSQLEAVCKVRSINKAVIYSRDEARRRAFADELSRACGVEVVPAAKSDDAAVGQDIVITATSSREPVLFGAWLADGAHLNLIGSNFLAKTETDVDVFRRATLVTVDSKEQGKLEAGDFVAPMREGVFGWADVLEFAHVLTGRYPGRQSPKDITVFKSLGLGIEDIAVAVKVVEKAQAAGVGKEIL